MSERPKIIVVRKKKVTAGGHHGGSWKVAYADFVTAMMAFFLVMWIMGMDQGVKDMVQGYFNNPMHFNERVPGGGGSLVGAQTALQRMEVRRTLALTREAQEQRFEDAARALAGRIRAAGLLAGVDADVEIVVTSEGLRIDIMETGDQDPFFERSSSSPKPALVRILDAVAAELAQLPNDVIVEGHTDAAPFRGGRTGYSNWELSVDRANAARRSLAASGLPEKRLAEVRGYADRTLKVREDPYAPRNRRISVLLPFTMEEAGITTSDLDRVLGGHAAPVPLEEPLQDPSPLPGARP